MNGMQTAQGQEGPREKLEAITPAADDRAAAHPAAPAQAAAAVATAAASYGKGALLS